MTLENLLCSHIVNGKFEIISIFLIYLSCVIYIMEVLTHINVVP